MSARIFLALCLSTAGLVVHLATASAVAGGEAKRSPASKEFNPAHRTVELFAAMQSGDLEVKFIPRDATRARILVANKTDEPLNVRLPDVFAGVPVLAQFQPGPRFPPANNRQNNNQNNANQAVGGGLNQFQGGGQNGNLRGQNFFNVQAEKVRRLKVRCVCLEHGKPDPRAAVPYRLVPLESVQSGEPVAAMLRRFGSENLDQRTAQAAVWYLTGDLDWSQLAAKTVRRANGTRSPYFSGAELKQARRIVAEAEASAAPVQSVGQREKVASDGRRRRNSLGFARGID